MASTWSVRRSSRVVLVAALAFVGACGSDSTGPDPNPNPDPSESSMSARIDGQQWTANIGIHAVRASGAIGLAGSDGARLISLGFVGSSPGTFPIGGASGANASVTDANGTLVWMASVAQGSGSITVTALDENHVAGTFSFVAPPSSTTSATGTRTVTEGSFNVRF